MAPPAGVLRSSSAARGPPRAAWVAAVLATLIGCLITLPWEAQIDSEFVRDRTYDAVGANAPLIEDAAFTRTTEMIAAVDGTRLEAWVYLPKGLSK